MTFILITLFVLLYLVITRCAPSYLEKKVKILGTDPVLYITEVLEACVGEMLVLSRLGINKIIPK